MTAARRLGESSFEVLTELAMVSGVEAIEGEGRGRAGGTWRT